MGTRASPDQVPRLSLSPRLEFAGFSQVLMFDHSLLQFMGHFNLEQPETSLKLGSPGFSLTPYHPHREGQSVAQYGKVLPRELDVGSLLG